MLLLLFRQGFYCDPSTFGRERDYRAKKIGLFQAETSFSIRPKQVFKMILLPALSGPFPPWPGFFPGALDNFLQH